MSDTYMIEVNSEAAGIVVRGPQGFQFFAASHAFNSMEGQFFKNARDAERAAYRVLLGRSAPKAPDLAPHTQDTVRPEAAFA